MSKTIPLKYNIIMTLKQTQIFKLLLNIDHNNYIYNICNLKDFFAFDEKITTTIFFSHIKNYILFPEIIILLISILYIIQ